MTNMPCCDTDSISNKYVGLPTNFSNYSSADSKADCLKDNPDVPEDCKAQFPSDNNGYLGCIDSKLTLCMQQKMAEHPSFLSQASDWFKQIGGVPGAKQILLGTPTPSPTPAGPYTPAPESSNTTMYVVVGVGLVALIGGIIYFTNK
tara:strand:+ start:18886 stop:19326 length:441 start_codon:yes stop_codon:yes gene_type:complete